MANTFRNRFPPSTLCGAFRAIMRGSYKATVDGKGRLKIPTDFKAALHQEYGEHPLDFYVTSLNGEKATVYPLPQWKRIEERLAALPSLSPARNKFLERTNYWGQMTRMDAQGRILIPQQLRHKASMRGEVIVMGYPDRLDVWNPQSFHEHMELEPITRDDQQELANLGI